MRRAGPRFAAALAACALLACATAKSPELAEERNPDPWQGFNRPMFAVTDAFDRWLLGPVASGWDYVLPHTVLVHIDQFFDNLNFPGYFVQPLLQGDPKQSGVAFARFGINTTVGIGGFFDPASHWLHLERRREDMGQTLGVWGAGPGPYLCLPIVLPTSDVRDASGTPVDAVLNLGDSSLVSWFVPWWWPAGLVHTINSRALVEKDLREAREAAFDWYSAVRDGYLQRRVVLIRNDTEAEEGSKDDLYEIDDTEPAPQ
jgi:phospholipid-binding lipoprotein MlaA